MEAGSRSGFGGDSIEEKDSDRRRGGRRHLWPMTDMMIANTSSYKQEDGQHCP